MVMGKRICRLIFCIILTAVQPALAVPVSSTAPNIKTPSIVPVYNVGDFVYVTFRTLCQGMTTNTNCSSTGNAFISNCPSGMVLVSGSEALIPPIPGTNYSTGAYYWQCMESISGWNPQPSTTGTAGSVQPYSNISFPVNTYNGTIGRINTSEGIFQGLLPDASMSPSWYQDMIDDSSGNSYYTYYYYPANRFLPAAIGGCGLLCGQPGDQITINCTNQAGQTLFSQTMAPPASPVLFFLGPSESANCSLIKYYQGYTSQPYPNQGCVGAPCSGSFSVDAGQAIQYTCCYGTFNVTGANFADPNVMTCNGCSNVGEYSQCTGKLNCKAVGKSGTNSNLCPLTGNPISASQPCSINLKPYYNPSTLPSAEQSFTSQSPSWKCSAGVCTYTPPPPPPPPPPPKKNLCPNGSTYMIRIPSGFEDICTCNSSNGVTICKKFI